MVVLVEMKLQSIEETSGIAWRIMDTDCKSDTNLQLSANRVYNKDCELSLGQSYTLECENTGNTFINMTSIKRSCLSVWQAYREYLNLHDQHKLYNL